jgi:hypothetical protein
MIIHTNTEIDGHLDILTDRQKADERGDRHTDRQAKRQMDK